MSVSLIDGGVALTVQIGSGVLDTGIKPNNERFNDNKWHYVRVHRRTSEVSAVFQIPCRPKAPHCKTRGEHVTLR